MGFSGNLALFRSDLPAAGFHDLVHERRRPLFDPGIWRCADGRALARANPGPDLAPESNALKRLVGRAGPGRRGP